MSNPSKKPGTMRKIFRYGLPAVLLIVAAIFTITQIAGRHYKKLLQENLPAAVAKATDGLYQVSFEDVEVNIFTRHLTISGLRMWPDSQKVAALRGLGEGPSWLGTLYVPEIQVQGGSTGGEDFSRHIELGRLWIGHPEIELNLYDKDPEHFTKALKSTPELNELLIKSVEIYKPKLKLRWERGTTHWTAGMEGGEVHGVKIRYQPTAPKSANRFLGATELYGSFENLYYDQDTGWYRLRLKMLDFSTAAGIEMKGLDIEPAMSKDSLYAQIGNQADIYDMHLTRLKAKGINWHQLLDSGIISLERMELFRPELSVYFSRVPPPNPESRRGRFPQQLMQKVPFDFSVPTIDVDDGSFTYTELNNKTMVPASIIFNGMAGAITNFTNALPDSSSNEWCSIAMSGKFQQTSDIMARLRLNLRSATAGFTLESRLVDLRGVQISDEASALALAQIPKMRLDTLDMLIRGNEYYSRGTITIVYDNLKVNVQKVDSLTKRMQGRPLLSLLANKMLLHPSNPLPGGPLRIANTYVERNEQKSFFSMIWQNLYQAAIETAFYDEGIKRVLKNMQARKAHKAAHGKKRYFKNLFKPK